MPVRIRERRAVREERKMLSASDVNPNHAAATPGAAKKTLGISVGSEALWKLLRHDNSFSVD